MKNVFIISLLFIGLNCSCNPKTNEPQINPKDTTTNQVDKSYNIDIKDFKMRDPFVFVDTIGKRYLIHASAGNNKTLIVYESKNLTKWKLLGTSFTAPSNFWGKLDFWAPDMFEYKGKYYITATFSASNVNRACAILVSDLPEGPYLPLVNNPITPSSWASLDATIYIDNGQPYLLYCREWLEVVDGQIYIQKLSDDLSKTIGDPQLLFSATSANWVGAITSGNGITGQVTDAPFIYKTSENKLIMIWSSFAKSNGKYSIGLARSTSGLITGPWVQDPNPLNNDDGGHAMIFKSFDGRTKISYHSPNTYPNYVTIYDLDLYQGNVTIINQ